MGTWQNSIRENQLMLKRYEEKRKILERQALLEEYEDGKK